jgi:gamma-glutamyltranspeptidase
VWGPREDPLQKLALAATWHRLGRGSAQEGQDHSALDALRDDAGACVWRVAASWSTGAAAAAAAASAASGGAASEGLAKGGRALLEAYVAAQVCLTSAQPLTSSVGNDRLCLTVIHQNRVHAVLVRLF